MAGHVPEWMRGNHKKTTNSKVEHGVKSRPIFHAENVHRDNPLREESPHSAAAYLADGGMVYMADGRDPTEEQLKQMGLDASNREREAAGSPGIVGGFRNLIERFKEGNIDAPGSLAYERYGAGRGKREYDNQKAFAENAKMQGDGMRDAGMVMRGDKMKVEDANKGAVVSAVPDQDKAEVKPLSSKPSMSYQNASIDEMKTDALKGGANLPKMDPNAVARPMGDAETKPKRTRSTGKDAPARNTAPNSQGTKPAEPKDSTAKRVVIPNNPRPPADNATRKTKPGARGGDAETRKSKPYPAEQAVQNLGKRFKEADDAYKKAPNAVNKQMRDEALKRYEKAAKESKR